MARDRFRLSPEEEEQLRRAAGALTAPMPPQAPDLPVYDLGDFDVEPEPGLDDLGPPEPDRSPGYIDPRVPPEMARFEAPEGARFSFGATPDAPRAAPATRLRGMTPLSPAASQSARSVPPSAQTPGAAGELIDPWAGLPPRAPLVHPWSGPEATAPTPQPDAQARDTPAPNPMPEAPNTTRPTVDSKIAMYGDPRNFAARMTSEEKERLMEAEAADDRTRRRRRILAGVSAGLGFLGARSGNTGLTQLGLAGLTGARQMLPDRQDLMQGRIDQRVAADQAGINARVGYEDRARQLQQAENDANRQAQQDALAARQVEANIGLTEARTRSTEAEAQQAALEAAAASGDADGMRAAIRATVAGLNDNSGLVQQWRALAASPEFDMMSIESLRDFSGQIAQMVNNRLAGLLERGGGGGGGMVTSIDPATGMTTTRYVGGSRPTGGGGGGAPRPAAAPTGAAASEGAPTADLSTDEALRREEYAAMRRAVPNLTDQEFGIAAAAMRRNRLSIEDMNTSAGQASIRAIVDAYRVAPAAEQARMQRQAEGTFVRAVGGEVPMPESVTENDYRRVAPRMTETYNEGVRPFVNARSSIRRAREAGLSEAEIRIALAGSRGQSWASNFTSVAQREAATRLMQDAGRAREAYGRVRSGAAIGQGEWDNFDRQLGIGSGVVGSSSEFDQAMGSLIATGRGVIRSIAGETGSPGDDVFDYWELQTFGRSTRRAR